MQTFQTFETTFEIAVPSQYVHENVGSEKPLLLLAHGFADTGVSFLRRALPHLDPRFEILAPNGPFPMPKYASGEWKDSFAWYFADFDAQQVRVHPRVAAKALAGLLERLGLKERPKILLGFSQGAYFLPHLAKELSNVRLFLTIGAGVQARFFEGNRVPIYGIHGSADDVIPLQTAQETFGEISSWNKGALTVIPGMTHTINELGRARLAQLLDESSCHLA